MPSKCSSCTFMRKIMIEGCINISGKPFCNKHVTFKEEDLKFIFVYCRSEDCVQHRRVYSILRLRIYSRFVTKVSVVLTASL